MGGEDEVTQAQFEELTAQYKALHEGVRSLVGEVAVLDAERQQVEVEHRQIQLLIEVEQRRQQLVEQIVAQCPSQPRSSELHAGLGNVATAGERLPKKGKKQRSRLRAAALPVSVEHPNADLVRSAELSNMGFLQRMARQLGVGGLAVCLIFLAVSTLVLASVYI